MDPNTVIGDLNTEHLLQSAYKPVPVPEAFAAKLEKKLLETAQNRMIPQLVPPSPFMTRLRWSILLAGVAACILIAFAFSAFQHSPQGNPNPSQPTSDLQLQPLQPGTEFVKWTNDVREGMMPRQRPAGPRLQTLKEGQWLATKAGQRSLVQLTDGTRLFVNEKSRVEATGPRQLTLHKGQIYLEVTPLEEGPRFVVKSANREITAVGTHFAVQADPAAAGVVVTQGKVKVVGINQEVTAGQQIAPGASTIITAPRASHTLEWTRDLMAAAETPMVPGCEHAGGALLAIDPNDQEIKLSLRQYHVDVHIEDGFARTTIDQTYFNTSWERLEGTFYFPLPPDASLSRLAMYVVDANNQCKLMEGGMAERQHAANVYETIRYQRRDPALLEWLDGSTFKMRVFPLEAKQEKRIILSYTQKLPTLYGVTRYRFPGGHTMPLVRDWSFSARVKNGVSLNLWSPSHEEMNWVANTGDMVGTLHAKNIQPKEDVVLEVQKRQATVDEGQPRFASFLHEKHTYLMLRYRPTLPSLPQRQRRDWIVLFETSGQRDPLLAGTQVDVLRQVLRNAEYDDTFVLLTANGKTQVYHDKPLPARPKNVEAALKFLQKTHLVGALDLQQGLQTALKFAKDAKNPHILHLGSGTPALGERDAGKLAKMLPASVPYVGVGVGKRWNRAFMKNAAERTNGLFTQINPDEVISWRAFDLLATLNTPRLLNVQILDGSEKTPFLTETTMIAQGEEICAITRVDLTQQPMPGRVIVKGTLDGKAVVHDFPVLSVLPGAGYLPRTWAKQEIDRLLADGASKNKSEIINLSKAMYVMSPFTSLLVLETDADYERFKVDRGRKDYWAIYACPPKIPLVYEPDGPVPPKQEVKKMPQPGQKPSVEEVLGTIVSRPLPASLSTIEDERLTEFAIDPVAWGIVNKDIKYDIERNEETSLPMLLQDRSERTVGEKKKDNSIAIRGFLSDPEAIFGLKLKQKASGDQRETVKQLEELETLSKARIKHRMKFFYQIPGADKDKKEQILSEGVRIQYFQKVIITEADKLRDDAKKMTKQESDVDFFDGRLWKTNGYTFNSAVPSDPAFVNGTSRVQFAPVFVSPQMNWANGITFGIKLEPEPKAVVSEVIIVGKEVTNDRVIRRSLGFHPGQLLPYEKQTPAGAALRYERPPLNYDRTMFTNLLQYAPGLHDTQADILATLEQEADIPSPKLGIIDPTRAT